MTAAEPTENLVTWVYEEGDYVPSAKLVGERRYSIVSDYLGKPVQAFDEQGNVVWQTDYDIYGNLRNLKGDRNFIPFRQLGQIEDEDIELYLNGFRYYDYHTGLYISQDPIGLAGNNPTLYGYVDNCNLQVDLLGLDCVPVKNKTKASNGLDYMSNSKHTPGQPGYRANAGVEPRNSLDLFGKSIASTSKPNQRYTYDSSTKTLHRFFGDQGTWHWSGSTKQGANSLKGSQVPNDIKKTFKLPTKGW